jgi:hypothetical protein
LKGATLKRYRRIGASQFSSPFQLYAHTARATYTASARSRSGCRYSSGIFYNENLQKH